MPSETVDGAIKWLRGEDAKMFEQVPSDLGGRHINELLGRHPFHPYDPSTPADHSCFAANETFYQCMVSRPDDERLHMKHVACYHPFKTDLMRCRAEETRARKRAAAATAQPPAT